jgi:hypothetical protein
MCAKELLRSEFGPSRRGWTFCPARARPSWIIRGACRLHDLEEVRKWEEKKRKEKENHENHDETEVLASATATLTVTLVHSLPLSLVLRNC